MEKIMIIGSGGAGKSTLARQLSVLLGIDVIHLDALFWKAGWIETPRDEWAAVQQAVLQQARWIADGNYGGTMNLRFERADTIIFLDLPRIVCLWRVIKRRIKYAGRSRPDLAPGCPEQLDWKFVRWIWNYPRARRPVILRQLASLADQKLVLHLTSRRDVARLLAQMRDLQRSGALDPSRLRAALPDLFLPAAPPQER